MLCIVLIHTDLEPKLKQQNPFALAETLINIFLAVSVPVFIMMTNIAIHSRCLRR